MIGRPKATVKIARISMLIAGIILIGRNKNVDKMYSNLKASSIDHFNIIIVNINNEMGIQRIAIFSFVVSNKSTP